MIVPPGYWMFDQGGTWTNNQPHTPPTGLGPTPGTHIQPHPVQTSDRKRLRAAKDRLRGWAKQYSRIDLPTFETALTSEYVRYFGGNALDQVDCNPAAFGVISGAREAITAKPRLCKRARRRTVLSPKNDKEHRRNQRERELLEALSRYYPVPQGQKEWTRSALLSIGKHRSDRPIRCDIPLT